MSIKDKILNGEMLTDEEIFDVIYDCEEGIYVEEEIINDLGRWEIYMTTVISIPETGRYFEISWGKGATEMQEDNLHESTFTEVVPKEVTTTIYVEKQ